AHTEDEDASGSNRISGAGSAYVFEYCTITTSTFTDSACNSYLFGGDTLTATGTYYDTITNVAGCDSLITIYLTINTVDNSVIQIGDTLFANASNATYQWVNCDSNFAPINGEVNKSYTPVANGNYAVIVSENGCTDTSVCYSVTVTGTSDTNYASSNSHVFIYPNPYNGNVTIDFGNVYDHIRIKIFDIYGSQVFAKQSHHTDEINIKITGASGLYFVFIQTDEWNTILRVVKY
ncbi:MAG: T9SS type A sorting domain-containing protein, partial [Bacteroidetes bacterium]|nr:T9SS type A sorting domain-containing protein [Bacteroidota bacterium]